MKHQELRCLIYYIFFVLILTGCPAAVAKGQNPEVEVRIPGVLPREACGVWCWYSTGGAPNKWDGKITAEETYPNMRGIPIVVGWNELEPEDGVYNWNLVDDIIKKAADHNTIRFPENMYGEATRTNTDRVLKICQEFAKYGAVVEDLDKTLAQSHTSRSRKGYNDVAWDRIDTDYRMYLYSIDQDKTSIGWWHIGPKDQPYGRFARGFEHTSGKDALYFKFHDKFFEGTPGKLKVRIIWLDNNDGEWALAYDAGSAELKIAKTIKGKNTGRWKEEEILIEDAVMKNNGPKGSDIALINTDEKDDIFHLLEVTRK